MTKLRFLIALPAILGFSAAVFGCADDDDGGIVGSGNVVSRDFEFSDFDSLSLAIFEAEITRSDTYSITLRADDNVIDRIDVDTPGDTLVMRLSPGTNLSGNVTMEATITMPTIESIELSGAASAELEGFGSLDELDLDLSGASEVTAELGADHIAIDASGASRVTLSGTAETVDLEASGASRLDLEDLVAESGEVELSGASTATVNITETIDRVDVSGASTFRYVGDPTLGDVSNSGASSIDQLD